MGDEGAFERKLYVIRRRVERAAAAAGVPEADFTIVSLSSRWIVYKGLLRASQLAAYYEEVVRELPQEPKLAANWIMGEFAAALNKENLEVGSGKLPPGRLAGLLRRICDQTISGKIAKEVFEAMWSGGASADAVIEAQGLRQITDTAAIERMIDEVMARNPAQLAEYRAGKDKLFGFFVGQVMKATAGKANPAQLNELLRRKLGG